MSDYEYKRGKLTRVETGHYSNEELAKSIVKTKSSWNDTYLQELMYDNDDYEVISDVIYKVEVQDIDPYADIFYAKKLDDSNIEFDVKYYNGGCSFSEALEIAINRLKDNK